MNRVSHVSWTGPRMRNPRNQCCVAGSRSTWIRIQLQYTPKKIYRGIGRTYWRYMICGKGKSEQVLSGYLVLKFTFLVPHGAAPPPPSKSSEGRYNSFERVKCPRLPTGIGERYSQTISHLCQAELLRRCELTLWAKLQNYGMIPIPVPYSISIIILSIAPVSQPLLQPQWSSDYIRGSYYWRTA